MIALDSPVATVLGAQTKQGKAKKITDGLGLRTVGDLLHHFPRRYVRTGELTKVDDARAAARCSPWSARSSRARSTPTTTAAPGRTAYRLDTTLQTDGPALRMSFFAKSKHVSRVARAAGSPSGAAGVFIGQVSTFRGQWQLTNPHDGAVRRRRATTRRPARLSLDAIKALLPDLPADQGRRLVGPPARDRLRAHRRRRGARPAARRRARASTTCPTSAPRCDWIHAPDTWAQVRTRPARFRFDEALVTQLVLARRRRGAGRSSARQARTGGRAGCSAAFDERLPFTLTAGQRGGRRPRSRPTSPSPTRCTGCSRARSAPARPSSRCGRCCASSTPAARRRCSRRPRCSPSSTTARSPRCSATSPRAACSAAPPTRTRVALLTGSMPKAAARRGAARRGASGEAGIVIGTHALLEEHGAVRRPRPGRRRRAAPLRRRAARRAHRQGRHPAARAGDDRDADPAHRRDDRLRRPRDLDADRAARRPRADPDQRRAARRAAGAGSTGSGSGCARRSRRATRCTSCARASPATSSSRASPTRRPSTTRASRWRPRRPAERCRGGRRVAARRGRSAGCGSSCCTAGCRPTTRTA